MKYEDKKKMPLFLYKFVHFVIKFGEKIYHLYKMQIKKMIQLIWNKRHISISLFWIVFFSSWVKHVCLFFIFVFLPFRSINVNRWKDENKMDNKIEKTNSQKTVGFINVWFFFILYALFLIITLTLTITFESINVLNHNKSSSFL